MSFYPLQMLPGLSLILSKVVIGEGYGSDAKDPIAQQKEDMKGVDGYGS